MVKWQDLKIFFKKRSRSRTLWYGGGSSIFALLVAISLLAGSEITTSGDLFSEDCVTKDGLKYCDIYANITLTYWQVCFNSTEFTPIYFDKEPVDYKVYVPTYGKDWRSLKVGDCIKRKNKWFTSPNKFKISVVLKPWQTIKYGVTFGHIDIDPYIFSDNIKLIDNIKYEKLCDEIFEEKKIPIYKNVTRYRLVDYNESCETPVTIINKTSVTYCNVSYKSNVLDYYDLINESIRCDLTGEVKIDDEILIKEPYYFCGLDEKGIICDEYKDSYGGGGDGNGDGICQSGETCIRR